LNILFYRYGSICEPDIIESFQTLGYTVYEHDTEIYDKNPVVGQIVNSISEFIQLHTIDCIFSINFFPILSEICKIYRIRYISWVVDAPVLELYAPSIKNTCNRTFIFDYTLYLEILPFNPDNVFYLPLASNISSKEKVISNALRSQEEYSANISFIGSLYTEKCPYNSIRGLSEYTRGYLEAIMSAQEKVYGYYFIEELLSDEIMTEVKNSCPNFCISPDTPLLTEKRLFSQYFIGSKITSMERIHTMELLSTHFLTTIYTGSVTSFLPELINRGTAKTLTEMPVIFHESQINLNTTAKSIRSGIPLRLWDIMASGGFVLSNFQTELSEYFQFGTHLDIYGSMEELMEKCNYYLSHEKERKEIAANGLEEVRRNHTYNIRINKLFDIAFSH